MDFAAIFPFGAQNLLIGFPVQNSFLFGLKKLHDGADKDGRYFIQ
jgi:hypothetical protein